MKGEFRNGVVVVEKSQRLIKRKFGKIHENHLILAPEESAYLVMKGTLEVSNGKKIMSFEEILSYGEPVRYFVYEDLRERGKRIGMEEIQEIFIPIHESSVLEIHSLKKSIDKKIAVVDSEGDVSYFLVENFDERGEHEEEIGEFQANFLNWYFVTDCVELHRKYFYGTEKAGRVLLSIYEGLYLIEKGVMNVKVDFDSIYESAIDFFKDFDRIYKIYRDLRERRFMVKTGLKFGSEFRVYRKIRDLREIEHSKYLVKLKEKITAMELAGDVRLCNAVKKTLLYPVFDGSKIKYISVRRVKP